ncbi:hypothetical protein V2J09_014007 [Rumex salicifolius]
MQSNLVNILLVLWALTLQSARLMIMMEEIGMKGRDQCPNAQATLQILEAGLMSKRYQARWLVGMLIHYMIMSGKMRIGNGLNLNVDTGSRSHLCLCFNIPVLRRIPDPFMHDDS